MEETKEIHRLRQEIVPTAWGDYIVALYSYNKPSMARLLSLPRYVSYTVGIYPPNDDKLVEFYKTSRSNHSDKDTNLMYDILVKYLPLYGIDYSQYGDIFIEATSSRT
jgi:hypothetical protein